MYKYLGLSSQWYLVKVDDADDECLELGMDATAALNCCGETVLEGYDMIHRCDSMGCYAETVIEREMSILTKDELNKYVRDVAEVCLLELRRWCVMGVFTRMAQKRATNLVDSRWLLKWKLTGGVWKIKARLTVRGFKDRQAEALASFAGTASREGQRTACSMATLYQWKLWPTDISMAFLGGKTFKLIAAETNAKLRSIQCDLPVGANMLLRQIEGFRDFSEITEVRDMNQPGFGTKDAPRSWSMALTETLVEASWRPASADTKLCVKRRKATEKDG
eukprot:4259523-Pyramimonas_sp.AAC.1